MQRRKLVSKLVLSGTALATLSACQQETIFYGENVGQKLSQPLVEWRCATSWPVELEETIYGGIKKLCQRIAQITNGRFRITPYPSGEITPALAILETVQNNKVECGHTSPSYFTKQSPALAFATTVPFGFNTQQQIAWLQAGGGLELLRKVYANFNVINFPAASTGNQMGGWFKQKIFSLSDLKQQKIRFIGLGGEVLRSLGVSIVTTSADEILNALQNGKIDAAEWTGPYDDEVLGLNKVAKYYYYPGWHQPGTSYDFLVNQDAYKRLPVTYQQAIITACTEAYASIYARYQYANLGAIKRLRSSGTEFVTFSQEILTTAREAAFDLYAENAQKDLDFRQIYQNWQAFRQQIYNWNQIGQLSYDNFVFPPK